MKKLLLITIIIIPIVFFVKKNIIDPSAIKSIQSDIFNMEQQLINLVNMERTSHGMKPLKVDKKLSEIALIKSKDMKKNNYFSHISPTYGYFNEMLTYFGVSYQIAGENIAEGIYTPYEVVNIWMTSKLNRRNILKPEFTHTGVGYLEEGSVWTLLFIQK
ncbi:CAP domain-containing protein [Bacillus sp. SCS-151]|uniref:CAP domain-containing protein n=1 Tax=Nanhaiella sioensis TaxID=3115293 RepID=UPI003979837A